MTATPTQFIITDEELESANGASYASLEVPGDYEAVLVSVTDYDKRQAGKTKGWEVVYNIQGLPFTVWISHSDAARWKLIEFVNAHSPGFFDVRGPDGTTRPVDPNEFIGSSVIAHVVLDEDMDRPMKVIAELFPWIDEEELQPEAVATL